MIPTTGVLFADLYRDNLTKLTADANSNVGYSKQVLEAWTSVKVIPDRERVGIYHYDASRYKGYGRGVFVIGDGLESADFVFFIVPGTTHSLKTAEELIWAGKNVYDQCKYLLGELEKGDKERKSTKLNDTTKVKYSKNDSVSVIVWIGYDAPQGAMAAVPFGANSGAPELIKDVDDIKKGIAARGKNPRITLSGHSYGSVVVGFAARQQWKSALNPRRGATTTSSVNARWVDALILLGSPGSGVSAAPNLSFSDSVFVGSNSFDVITQIGRLVPGLAFGRDPADIRFRSKRFTCYYGPKESAMMDLILGGQTFDGHSHYYDATAGTMTWPKRAKETDTEEEQNNKFMDNPVANPGQIIVDSKADNRSLRNICNIALGNIHDVTWVKGRRNVASP